MIRIAVCEDNLNEARTLRALLAEYQELHQQTEMQADYFTGAQELLDAMSQQEEYQLYLLDILMPGMDGIELSQALRKTGRKGVIIFLTATREYAYEAYGVRAIDYLLKPVNRENLFPALDNAAAQLGVRKKSFALIQMADGDKMVEMDDIVAVEVQGHTLCYYLTGGQLLKSKVLRVPFATVTEDLTEDGRFIRPHRSFLINATHVGSITKKSFIMDNDMEIPISRLRFTEVKEEYMSFLTRQGDTVWSVGNGGV